jgi:hypothetical protein
MLRQRAVAAEAVHLAPGPPMGRLVRAPVAPPPPPALVPSRVETKGRGGVHGARTPVARGQRLRPYRRGWSGLHGRWRTQRPGGAGASGRHTAGVRWGVGVGVAERARAVGDGQRRRWAPARRAGRQTPPRHRARAGRQRGVVPEPGPRRGGGKEGMVLESGTARMIRRGEVHDPASWLVHQGR